MERSAIRESGSLTQPRISLRVIRATSMRHRPVFIPTPRHVGLLLSVSPEGACGTLERFTAPAAPRANTWQPCTLAVHGVCVLTEHTILRAQLAKDPQDGHRSRYCALRSARDGLCGLLHVPRNCRFRRHAAWFGRTAARTCTWTVRPTLLRALSASQGMRAGVCRPCPAAPGRSIRNPRSFRPGIVAATATRSTT